MVWYLGGFAAMAAVMVGLALKLPSPTALYAWAGFAAAACLLGALAIASQPIGKATWLGRIGSIPMRWGFRAGRGRLAPAIGISWLVWLVLGFAVITAVQHRSDIRTALFTLAWCVDLLVLFRIVGLMLANRGPRKLLNIGAVLVGMLLVSGFFWLKGEPNAQRMALLIAGGPPALIGGGYALFLGFMMTVGRNARWN